MNLDDAFNVTIVIESAVGLALLHIMNIKAIHELVANFDWRRPGVTPPRDAAK